MPHFFESTFVAAYLSNAYYFVIGRREAMSTGTSEFVWSCLWILASTTLLTYTSYLYFGSVGASQQNIGPVVKITDTLLKPGEHHLSGFVPVPSPCHGLSVRTEVVSDTLYKIVLTSWQEPTRTCEPHEQVRAFQTVVFAPSTGVSFIATLDDREIPISLSTRY